jgi:hypothetical protein
VAVQTSRLLAGALASLAPEDRLILELRFVRGLTMKEIAKALPASAVDNPKVLYRRLRRLLDELRDRLEERGVKRADALDVIGSAQIALPRLLARDAGEDSGVLKSSKVLEFGVREFSVPEFGVAELAVLESAVSESEIPESGRLETPQL